MDIFLIATKLRVFFSEIFLNSSFFQNFLAAVLPRYKGLCNSVHHAQPVRDRSSSYKIDYVIVIRNFLNLEEYQNPISGSKVRAILLKGWILPW